MDLKNLADSIPVVLMGIYWFRLWLEHAKKLKNKGEDGGKAGQDGNDREENREEFLQFVETILFCGYVLLARIASAIGA